MTDITFEKSMYTIDEVKELIKTKKKFLLAGDEELLKQIPAGSWIGGTIPYFMTDQGGKTTRDEIYVTLLPDEDITDLNIKVYDENSINKVYSEAPDNGFSLIILPATTSIHLKFALNAPMFPDFAIRPLIGWIAGIHLDDLGKITPKVFDGSTGSIYEDKGVVMHLSLPKNKFAEINIINIFEQGKGDTITFEENGFSVTEAIINGEKANFADYVKSRNLDTRFPLVANYNGIMINISYQTIDEDKKRVDFYAPVFKGVEYKHAADIKDYVGQFTAQIPKEGVDDVAFSCNCILNYLYSELEGKKTGDGVTGPMTFGEIAYQLLNQTMVYLTINELID